MNTDLKKIVSRVKNAQSKLQSMMKKQDWMEEARKYAEKQGNEVKKLFSSDMDKVKTFIERERKELERFQKQIPGEVKKFRTMLMQQRKDLEKMLGSLGAISGGKAKGKVRSKKKGSSKTKSASTKKKSSKASSSS